MPSKALPKKVHFGAIHVVLKNTKRFKKQLFVPVEEQLRITSEQGRTIWIRLSGAMWLTIVAHDSFISVDGKNVLLHLLARDPDTLARA